MRSIVVVALMWGLVLPVQIANGQETAAITHGTLITVLGNKSGLVAMTDSMVTKTGPTGVENPDPANPGQKLMQYGERTVCATAGALVIPPSMFGKPQDKILRKLNTQVLGLIQFYRDAVKKQGKPQTMADTLEGLSAVIRHDFQVLSDLNSSLKPTFTYDYHLELFLAGFDLDGNPKIGRVDIVVKREYWPDGRLRMVALETPNNCKLHEVGDELDICSGGLDNAETEIRNHPEHYLTISAVRDYEASWKKDHGASLSIKQMRALGRAFKDVTPDARVGGPDQVAIITKEKLDLEVPGHLPDITVPRRFVLASCPPGYEFPISSPLLETEIPVVFQHCDFVSGGEEHHLDGHIYLKCKFRDANLIYLGGDTVFGPDNIVEGRSSLMLGPGACRRPDIAEDLANRFDFIHGGSLWPGTEQVAQPPCKAARPTGKP